MGEQNPLRPKNKVLLSEYGAKEDNSIPAVKQGDGGGLSKKERAAIIGKLKKDRILKREIENVPITRSSTRAKEY